MATGIVYAKLEDMHEFMRLGFIAAGVPPDDAKICADVLNESDKRGIDSHGVARLKPMYIDRIKQGIQKPITQFEIVRETPSTTVINGHDGMGHVISVRAMQITIEKAKKCGLAMTVVTGSTHYGIAGYYALMAAKENQICITGTNTRPSIAPTFGVENMLGTNPLCIGFPTDEEFPFCIDCATSIAQRGKIEHYARINKTMPSGWVIDEHGNAVTDPQIALKGLTAGTCALTPLGGIGEELAGYKGYGYATVVEVLSSALQGGVFLKSLTGIGSDGKPKPFGLGHFFISVDVNAFVDPAVFKKTAGDILRQLRASKKAEGQDRIYTANEKEYLAYLERSKNGVPLNATVRTSLQSVRDEYKIDYVFSWEK
jgi:LDH2 family malate/lactate/ureidoglycolate dehydrogenase